jgi:PAS domain S-box-containing protein
MWARDRILLLSPGPIGYDDSGAPFFPEIGGIMREIEQSVDGLRRTVSEMARGLKLQTEAEWMGGFGTTVWNLETNDIWISEGAYRIFGLRRLSAVSEPELVATVVHPEDVEAVETGLVAVLEGGEYDIVHRVVRPDGEVRHIHAKALRIEGDDSHPPVLLAAVVDVTPST